MISRPEIQAFLGTYQEGAEKFPVHLQLHPGVDPSSIFLTGSSGSGKSTAGQCMAIQFAKQRTPLLALDLGHTLSPDHICPPLSSEFEALAIRHDLYNEPVPTDILNPKPCGSNTESPYDTAYGLCQIIGQNNRFGPAQIALLTAEVKTIVERREICPHIFPSILKALKSSTSANVRMLGNRLEPLLQHDVFERRQNGSSSLPISPHIHIFDVSSYPDTIRTTLAELLLYDWFRSARALQIPIVIMVDEVQNLRLLICAAVNFALVKLCNKTLYELIYTFLQKPLESVMQGLPGLLILMLVAQLFWCIGIHGNQIIKAVRDPLLNAAILANTDLIAQGVTDMSKYNIINMSFWDTYMSLGGSGCTLGLIIAIFLFSKRADYRAIAKLSVGPGIFEINECMTFGLPIVLNPYLVLPFIITPLINGTIGYFATKIGFAGVALYAMPWTTPPIISAWLSTGGSIGAVITQLICIVVSVVIYTPFVILANKEPVAEEA